MPREALPPTLAYPARPASSSPFVPRQPMWRFYPPLMRGPSRPRTALPVPTGGVVDGSGRVDVQAEVESLTAKMGEAMNLLQPGMGEEQQVAALHRLQEGMMLSSQLQERLADEPYIPESQKGYGLVVVAVAAVGGIALGAVVGRMIG